MDYQLIRSRRRTVAIQILKDGVIVRAPMKLPAAVIQAFVESKRGWIEKKLAAQTQVLPGFTQAQLDELTGQAKQELPQKAAQYAALLGVDYGRITVRHQKTRWGSCSGKKNLNFNCLLMLAPERVRDYVVVHELCHLLEMNHSSRFWALVEKRMPDYRDARRWLRTRGKELIDRL
jgi:predicted metal-dependent hydrolase